MIAAFVEAINDLTLPCSLTLLIPGVAASLAARARAVAVALSAFGGMAAIGWLRVTDQIPANLTVWVAAGVGFLVLISFGALYSPRTRTAQRVTAGAVIGAAAAAIWTPCVGEELGVILNTGPDDPLGVLLPFIAFVAGINLVALAIALARVALEPPARVSKVLSITGTAAGVAVALLLGSGLYSDVVARLVIWSL